LSAYRLYLVLWGFASFAGHLAFTLDIVYQTQVVGLGPLQLVLVGTVTEVVAFVAQVPTGVIADLYSRRLSVIVGYLLMGVGLLVWGLVPSFAVILAANAVWAVGAVCVDGAEEAWAADEIGAERIGRAFVRGGQIGQVGTVLGIIAAVGLARFGLAVPIVAAGIVVFLIGVALAVLMPENGWAPAPREQRSTWRSMRSQVVLGGRAVRRSAILTGLLAGALFLGMSSEGFDRLWQPHLLLDLRFPPALSPNMWFGLLAIVGAIASVAVTGLLGRRLDAMHPQRVGILLAAVQAVGAAGMIGFGLAGRFWPALVAYLAVRLMRNAARPLMNAWLVSSTSSSSRATVFSMQAQVDALGQIAGGPPAGYVGQRMSTGAGVTTSGLFVLPAVLLFGWAALRYKQQPVLAEA
jgi:Major Facilitator Superfamily